MNSRQSSPSRWVAGATAVSLLLTGCETGGWPFLSVGAVWGAVLIFVLGAVSITVGARSWIARIDHHALLRSDERLQNKDAVVIASFCVMLLHLGLCIAGTAAATTHPSRAVPAVFLALVWALAAVAVGGAFGFLLGHPRRLVEETVAKDGGSGTTWLLRTGLDDIVDWLVKGITTVLLVNSKDLVGQLNPMAQSLTGGLLGLPSGEVPSNALALAQGLIVFFTVFGALAGCLITRTYLTGALTRADRSTTGAFSRVGLDWGEVLSLLSSQRSLGSRGGQMNPESLRVAKKLAQLSLNDLRTPQEYALWAKAKSATGASQEALEGYERAVLQCDCEPAMLLDYSVALHAAGQAKSAVQRLEQAHLHVSAATPEETVKNIHKSFTFQLLYEPMRFDRVLALVAEYRRRPTALPSGGLLVNEACAWGQRFNWLAAERGLLETNAAGTLVKPLLMKESMVARPELKEAYEGAFGAARAAIAIEPGWKRQLRTLLESAEPMGGEPDIENDLEVFERDPAFRALLDLAPWSEAASPPNQTDQEQQTGHLEMNPAIGAPVEGAEGETPGVEVVQTTTAPAAATETAPSLPSTEQAR